jgi:hypothetical protein
VKRRFGLTERCEQDAFLHDLMKRRLMLAEGKYQRPRGVRSALVHWDVETYRARG